MQIYQIRNGCYFPSKQKKKNIEEKFPSLTYEPGEGNVQSSTPSLHGSDPSLVTGTATASPLQSKCN